MQGFASYRYFLCVSRLCWPADCSTMRKMASNVCDSNQNSVEIDMDATQVTQPEDKPVKPTIPEEEFGSGICDFSYQPQVVKDMGKLFQQETFSDVMLMAEGRSIPCHKFVLAAASEYFYNRLVMEPEGVKHNLLELEDISFPLLKVIISYIYTGCINITVENASDVFPVLQRLKLKSACDACEPFLVDAVNPSNCIGLYRMATAEQNAQLLKVKAEEVMVNNFQEVISYPEFQNLSLQELEQYIQSDNLRVPNEDAVFGAVVSWCGYNAEARIPDFIRVIKHVRLHYCTNHYLSQVVAHEPLMESLECHKLVIAAMASKSTDTCSIHQNQAALDQDYSASPRRSYRKASTMLVVGGNISVDQCDDCPSSQCWYLYKNEWNNTKASALPLDIDLFSACVLPSGILVTGGALLYTGKGAANECWLLSTSNLQWTAVAELNTGRYRHASVSVGGQPYVVGGMDSDENPLSSVECLSDISDKWDKMPNLPKTMYHAIAVSYRGQLCLYLVEILMTLFFCPPLCSERTKVTGKSCLTCLENVTLDPV